MNLTNRDLLIAEWLNAGGVKAKKGILKKLADKYEVPDSTARRWKKEYIEKNGTNGKKRTGERIKKSKRFKNKKRNFGRSTEKRGNEKQRYFVSYVLSEKERAFRFNAKKKPKLI